MIREASSSSQAIHHTSEVGKCVCVNLKCQSLFLNMSDIRARAAKNNEPPSTECVRGNLCCTSVLLLTGKNVLLVHHTMPNVNLLLGVQIQPH